jgi:hypothetical protein
MIRRAAVAALATGLVLAVPAAAGPPGSIFENQYEGRAERTRDTYVGFDVIRTQGGRKVANVSALLRYHCVNGDGGQAAGRVNGRLRVNGDRFAGTLRGQPEPFRGAHRQGPPGDSRLKYRVKGALLENGKAKGTIDATLKVAPVLARGGQLLRCYTGELDWKARRGADVPVEA